MLPFSACFFFFSYSKTALTVSREWETERGLCLPPYCWYRSSTGLVLSCFRGPGLLGVATELVTSSSGMKELLTVTVLGEVGVALELDSIEIV